MKIKAKLILYFIAAILFAGSLLFVAFLSIFKRDRGVVLADATETDSGVTISHISRFTQNSYSTYSESVTWTGSIADFFDHYDNNIGHLDWNSATIPLNSSYYVYIKSDSAYVLDSPLSDVPFLHPFMWSPSLNVWCDRKFFSFSLFESFGIRQRLSRQSS